jgi:hypothetical protein
MTMRLYVKTADISTSPQPHLGERSYLQLDVTLTASQHREAIVTLLGELPGPAALRLLQSEFPELLRNSAGQPDQAVPAHGGYDPRQSELQDEEDRAYIAQAQA